MGQQGCLGLGSRGYGLLGVAIEQYAVVGEHQQIRRAGRHGVLLLGEDERVAATAIKFERLGACRHWHAVGQAYGVLRFLHIGGAVGHLLWLQCAAVDDMARGEGKGYVVVGLLVNVVVVVLPFVPVIAINLTFFGSK